MNSEELIRSWKDPRVRPAGLADHPAGEIRLPSQGALGWRANVLAGREMLEAGHTDVGTWQTVSSAAPVAQDGF